MPHVRMSRNLNQSVFALIVGTIFSVLLIPVFGMNVLILAIFEIPLAFLVALIAVTECLYQYTSIEIIRHFDTCCSVLWGHHNNSQ
ncbi:MAG: hypothetical protein ACTSO5_03620 [Candidatus Heimdallarchaeaceae archaeon]